MSVFLNNAGTKDALGETILDAFDLSAASVVNRDHHHHASKLVRSAEKRFPITLQSTDVVVEMGMGARVEDIAARLQGQPTVRIVWLAHLLVALTHYTTFDVDKEREALATKIVAAALGGGVIPMDTYSSKRLHLAAKGRKIRNGASISALAALVNAEVGLMRAELHGA